MTQHQSCDDILIKVGALRQAAGGVAVALGPLLASFPWWSTLVL